MRRAHIAVGLLDETCGAVTGVMMVLGLKSGAVSPDREAKELVYSRVWEFADSFKAISGSLACRNLLGCDISTPDGHQIAKEKSLFTNFCPKLVQDSVEILEAMLAEGNGADGAAASLDGFWFEAACDAIDTSPTLAQQPKPRWDCSRECHSDTWQSPVCIFSQEIANPTHSPHQSRHRVSPCPGPLATCRRASYTDRMAEKTLTALDYLAHPAKHPPRPVSAVFGDETFLRRQAILALRAAVLGDEDDFSLKTFEGRGTLFRDVHEELSTVAMFGGKRLVVVENADDFVTRYRTELEDYVVRPSGSGVLVLDLDALPSNTRLHKSIAADGLLIDCGSPTPARLCKWLADWAKQHHDVQLPQAAAESLVELIGPELGLLDQELAKLALLAGEDRKITAEMVGQSVGGWRAKTTWEMLDAALDGRTREALLQLDRLLASGEQPIGILGQISASLRRFAAATRLVIQAESARRRTNLREVLEQSGVRSFVLKKAERQLRLLGRQRGSQVYRWLLQADLDLKGESSLPPRLILERLIVRLSTRREAVAPHAGG